MKLKDFFKKKTTIEKIESHPGVNSCTEVVGNEYVVWLAKGYRFTKGDLAGHNQGTFSNVRELKKAKPMLKKN